MSGHFVEGAAKRARRVVGGGLANATNAGANAASSGGDFFVARAGDTLFEIDKARGGEDRMGVGIDEAGKDDLAAAVDFFGFVAPSSLVLRRVRRWCRRRRFCRLR